MVQISRVHFSGGTARAHKDNRFFDFPESLDLDRFCVESEEATRYKDLCWNEERGQKGGEYQLKGIINHSGNAQFGHFYSFLEVDGEWFCFNDTLVKRWSKQSILKFAKGMGDSRSQSNAYCLLYAKSNDRLCLTDF